jgi:protein-tyrosine phosphatase
MAADRISLSYTVNTRDLGGYAILGKQVTKYGAILRSDALTVVADSDIAILRAMNIGTLIDLRTESEVASKPCPLADNPTFAYYNCPVCSGRLPPDPQAIPRIYYGIASSHYVMYTIFKRISDASSGILFFCTAGNDRTGVIAALILSLVGVGNDDIISDYMLSGVYLRDVINKWEASHPDFPSGIVAPRTAYMEQFLSLFGKKYASVQEYLLKIGMTCQQINRIRERITL